MNRRDVVRIVTATLLPVCARPQVLNHREFPVARSLRIPIAEDEFIEDFASADDGLCFLIGNRSTPAWSVLSTTPAGTPTRLWALPGGQLYTEIGIAADGRLIARYMQRSGNESGLYMLRPDGAIHQAARIVAAPQHIMTMCVVDDVVIVLNSDGSFDQFDPAVAEMTRLRAVFPKPVYTEMRLANDRSIVLLERTTGRIGRLDLALDTVLSAHLEAPEISESLDRLHGWVAEQEAGGIDTVAPPLLITAWNVDKTNSIYALIAPINRAKGALVVRAQVSGEVDDLFRLRMPDRTTRKSLPHHLGVVGSTLALVYWDGNIDLYTV